MCNVACVCCSTRTARLNIDFPKESNDEYPSADSFSVDHSVLPQTGPTHRTKETTPSYANRKHTVLVERLGRENGSYQDTTARTSLIPLVSSAKKAFFD